MGPGDSTTVPGPEETSWIPPEPCLQEKEGQDCLLCRRGSGAPMLVGGGQCRSLTRTGPSHGLLACPQVYEIPFLVALDHRKESVVVAVRGTMSLQVRSPGTGGVAGDRPCLTPEPTLSEVTRPTPPTVYPASLPWVSDTSRKAPLAAFSGFLWAAYVLQWCSPTCISFMG